MDRALSSNRAGGPFNRRRVLPSLREAAVVEEHVAIVIVAQLACAAAEPGRSESAAAHAENAVPGTATEIAELIDDLRRRANEAELVRNEATKRADSAEAQIAAAAERASKAENLANQVDEAAAKALERADAAESAVHEKERATGEILSAIEGVSERDMAAVARAEAERAAAAETRVRACLLYTSPSPRD